VEVVVVQFHSKKKEVVEVAEMEYYYFRPLRYDSVQA